MHSRIENVTKLTTEVALDSSRQQSLISRAHRSLKKGFECEKKTSEGNLFWLLVYSSICATPVKASEESFYKAKMNEEKKTRQKLYKISDGARDFSLWKKANSGGIYNQVTGTNC